MVEIFLWNRKLLELKEKVSMKNYGIPKNNNFHCFLKVRGQGLTMQIQHNY